MSFYAVKRGRTVGIYETWGECFSQVAGYSNAEYKKFEDYEEAERYIGIGIPKKVGISLTAVTSQFAVTDETVSVCSRESETLRDCEAIAYVDGSYDNKTGRFSYASVIYTNTHEYRICGCDDYAELADLHNISGELMAVFRTMFKAQELGIRKLKLVYDYEGIQKWVTGGWSARTRITQLYQGFVRAVMQTIDIDFSWVKGHSGISGNEAADKLAREAMKKNIKVDSSDYLNRAYLFCRDYYRAKSQGVPMQMQMA